MRIVRTSKHTLTYSNTCKKNNVQSFLDEYKQAVEQYANYIWNNTISYKAKDKNKKEITKTFNITTNQLDCPGMLDYNLIHFNTKLSARVLSSAATQACGMVKAATEKRRKQLYVVEELKKENKSTKTLQAKIDKFPLVIPTFPDNFKAELSSKCCEFKESSDTTFDGWLKVKCLGSFPTMFIPIRWTKHSNRFKKDKFKLLGSFLIYEDNVDFRWEKEVELKSKGDIVGCDPGVIDLLSFSNGIKIPVHPHKHTYSKILDTISRRVKGSKGIKRSYALRTNYVNWCFNQIDLSNIKEFDIEDNGHLHYKNNKGRKLSHNAWSVIKEKAQSLAERGVRVKLIRCAYRSQRCSVCGWVQQKNRKGKVFSCLNCSYSDDADHNSAVNQTIELPRITEQFRKKKYNLTGFFWLPVGVSFRRNQEQTGVPDVLEKHLNI